MQKRRNTSADVRWRHALPEVATADDFPLMLCQFSDLSSVAYMGMTIAARITPAQKDVVTRILVDSDVACLQTTEDLLFAFEILPVSYTHLTLPTKRIV